MILNLKLLCFLDPSEIKPHFSKINSEFHDINDKFASFLEYFDKTWISGIFDLKDWNYSLAIVENGIDIGLSQTLHFTNNAVEGANSLINSLLNKGMRRILFKFDYINFY